MTRRPKRLPSTAEEAEFLASYRPGKYPRPAVTVDLAIFSVVEARLQLLLIKRGGHPFRDHWALPGGFLHVAEERDDQGEDLEVAARRELAEETGLDTQGLFLEQLQTFGRVFRDPRMRVISVAYVALLPPCRAGEIEAGSDAREVAWLPVAEIETISLAFDHDEIIDAAVGRLRDDLDRSRLAFELVSEPFTTSELRRVHELIEGRTLDAGNFRRRFNRLIERGVVEEAGEERATGHRPARLYRLVAF